MKVIYVDIDETICNRESSTDFGVVHDYTKAEPIQENIDKKFKGKIFYSSRLNYFPLWKDVQIIKLSYIVALMIFKSILILFSALWDLLTEIFSYLIIYIHDWRNKQLILSSHEYVSLGTHKIYLLKTKKKYLTYHLYVLSMVKGTSSLLETSLYTN